MERVVVAGGGVAGLAVALSLADSSREVTLVERDSEPPEIPPQDAFERWDRPGVPQFRHAHILLARLHTTVRDHHPELMRELAAAGISVSKLDQMLPPTHLEAYRPSTADADLLHLWGRRATFEYVLRRHVGRQAHVRFVHDARVEGIASQPTPDGIAVTGIDIRRADRREHLEADVVVDASGAQTKFPRFFADLGVDLEVEEHDSHYAYYCRHYRLRDPSTEPSRQGTGANLDYLWFGTFYAEAGNFAIALSCPTEEKELVDLLQRPAGFERVCRQMPVLARWTELSEPTSNVLGARRLANRWRKYHDTRLSGFFPVGDSHLSTNPMYGRGCSSAFLQAHALREALDASDAAGPRAERYYALCRAKLRSHFDSAVSADRLFQNRARRGRGGRLPWPDRVINYLYDAAWTPALLRSPLVAREMIKAMEMREISDFGTRLRVLLHIAGAFVRSLAGVTPPAPPRLGPGRDELMRALGREEGQAA